MIVEYTEQEQKELSKINKHFDKLLNDIDEDFLKVELNSNDYIALLEKRESILNSKRFEIFNIHEAAEQRFIKEIGTNKEELLKAAFIQVPLIIHNYTEYDLIINSNGQLEPRTKENRSILSDEKAKKIINDGIAPIKKST